MRNVLAIGAVAVAMSVVPALAQSQQRQTQPQTQTGTNTARPAATAQTKAAPKASSDEQVVIDSIKGNMAEVELGQLAQQNASSEDVKRFGERMVADHGKANEELKTLAQNKNITVPTEVDPKHKTVHDRLAKLSGAAFDRAYLQQMIQDHREKAAKVRTVSRTAKDPDIKAWAAKTLPTVEEHLKLAQTTAGRPVGTSGTKEKGTEQRPESKPQGAQPKPQGAQPPR